MRIAGISGSLRPGSYNRALLRAAAGELPRGARLEVVDGFGELPFYDEELDARSTPAAAAALRETLAAADAVLIATPEYNGSLPAVLKNALDWASRPFPGNCLRGKPVAVIGASTGLFGAVWAQAEARKVLKVLGASVLDAEVRVPMAHQAFDDDGRLLDPSHAAALRAVLGELVRGEARSAA